MRVFLIALALLGLPALSACENKNSSPSFEDKTADKASSAALRLAQLVQPEDVTIPQAKLNYASELFYQSGQATELGSLEARYPGLTQEIIDATWPHLKRDLDARIKPMWNELGLLYDENLTEDEIAWITKFFESPTGRKYIVALNSVDPKTLRATMEESGGFSPEAQVELTNMAAARIAEEFTDEELAEVAAFERQAATPLTKLGMGAMNIVRNFVNSPMLPENAAALQEARSEVIEKRAGAGGSR